MHTDIITSVPTPIIFILFPFLIAGFLINTLFIYLFLAKKNVSFGKSMLGAFYSYLVLAVFGLCISFYNNLSANFLWFLLYYAIAVGVQWIITIPLYRNEQVSKFRLLYTSIIGNTIIFSVFVYILFYGTGVVLKYINLVKIAVEQQGLTF